MLQASEGLEALFGLWAARVWLAEGMMLVWLKKLLRVFSNLFLIAFLVVMFSGLVISNPQKITVSLWNWQVAMELSTALFFSFWIGAGLATLAGLFLFLRLNLRNRSLKRQLNHREQELQKLKVSALRGLSS